MEDYTKLSATLQGELIERGQLCPVELCETFLEKIHNNPDSDSIFSEIKGSILSVFIVEDLRIVPCTSYPFSINNFAK